MCHRRWMLNQGVDITQANPQTTHSQTIHELPRSLITTDFDGDHRPEIVHLTSRHFVSLMTL